MVKPLFLTISAVMTKKVHLLLKTLKGVFLNGLKCKDDWLNILAIALMMVSGKTKIIAIRIKMRSINLLRMLTREKYLSIVIMIVVILC